MLAFNKLIRHVFTTFQFDENVQVVKLCLRLHNLKKIYQAL
jgi:(p)ppGpp synthase/HD superfamily hydrolase